MGKKKSKRLSTKKRPEPNKGKKTSNRVSVVGTLLFIFALIGALADLSGANSQIRRWGQSLGVGLPFPKARGDEILIIVTNFSGSSNLDAETRIYRELRERTSSSGLTNVRIERLENQTPAVEQDASNIGLHYKATLVIWGTVDSVGIEPRYTVVKNREYIVSQPDLGITFATDFPTFSAYVVEGAPKEYEYLLLFSVGQIAYFSEAYEQALSLFSEAVNIDLGSRAEELDIETIYFYRGYAHRVLEEISEALADFTQAININNSNALFFCARGNTYSETGSFDAAIEDHSQAIKLKPDEAAYFVNRGNAFDAKGEYDNALQDYNQAISLNPKLALAFANRGVLYENKGDGDAALADFDHAIELEPDIGFTYFVRGMFYYRQGDLDKAINDYNTAIDKGWDIVDVYYYRGRSYYEKKNYRAALKNYNIALEIDPYLSTAYNDKGNVYHALNDLDEALANLNRAIELNPDYGLAYYNRGAVYDDMGNKTAAIADFKKTLELGNVEDKYLEVAKWRIEILGGGTVP